MEREPLRRVQLLGLGDNTIDRYLDHGLAYPGGNAVNVAVQARRLGADAAYLGCVGDDDAGRMLEEALAAEGVAAPRLRRITGVPTAYSAIRHEGTERRIAEEFYGASVAWDLNHDDLTYLQDFHVVHTSVYSRLDGRLPDLSRHAQLLSYDFADGWDDAAIAAVAPHLDVAFLSAPAARPEEAMRLAERIRAVGPATVVVTLGAHGSIIASAEGALHQSAVATEVVDTLGAGDAYVAAFLVASLQGAGAADAARGAALHAARACSTMGAFGHARPFP